IIIVVQIFFGLYIIVSCLYWSIEFIAYFFIRKTCLQISKLPLNNMRTWPRVSLIMTACNEENKIQAAIREKLKNGYPEIECILVEDRSTDSTPQIADQLAAEDSRLKVIHIKEIPEGWLGKINARNQGVKQAAGNWLIFSDADVCIRPGTVKRAVVYAEEKELDHVAIFPHLMKTKWLLDATLCVFVRMLCAGGRIWKISDAKSDAAVGSGSFNMVRRTTLQNSPGFEYIKLEPGDDVALGMMLKKSGARSCLLSGRDYVKVRFYRDLKEMAIGSERATFTSLGNFSFFRIVVVFLILMAIELAPFIVFLTGFNNCLWLIGIFFIIMSYSTTILYNQWFRHFTISNMFWPTGAFVFAYCAIRAGYLGMKRKGIYWRGTFYSTDLLRRGKRMRMNAIGNFKSNSG